MNTEVDFQKIRNTAESYYRNGDFYCSEAVVKTIKDESISFLRQIYRTIFSIIQHQLKRIFSLMPITFLANMVKFWLKNYQNLLKTIRI